jgi:hypothetical protein
MQYTTRRIKVTCPILSEGNGGSKGFLTQRYKAAQKISDETMRLTSREDFRLIQEVSLARYNVKQTKSALQRVLALKTGIEEVQGILSVC